MGVIPFFASNRLHGMKKERGVFMDLLTSLGWDQHLSAQQLPPLAMLGQTSTGLLPLTLLFLLARMVATISFSPIISFTTIVDRVVSCHHLLWAWCVGYHKVQRIFPWHSAFHLTMFVHSAQISFHLCMLSVCSYKPLFDFCLTGKGGFVQLGCKWILYWKFSKISIKSCFFLHLVSKRSSFTLFSSVFVILYFINAFSIEHSQDEWE